MSLFDSLDAFYTNYEAFPYADETKLVINWYTDRIITQLKNPEELSVLELGIGYGDSSLKFSKHFSKHVIIEGSKKAIDKFKEKAIGDTKIIHTLFEEYESSDYFDVIMMGFILEHVQDPEVILKRFRKHLVPDGSLFIIVPNFEALNKRLGLHAGLIKNLSDLSEADLSVGHKRLFSVNSLNSLVSACGYYVNSVEGIYLKPFATKQIESLNLSNSIITGLFKEGIHYPELCTSILIQAKRNAMA